MVGMGAMLAATMGAPLTAVVFAVELTHNVNATTPLIVAAATAYGGAVLAMRRSILTEKLARRGYHLSREYSVDPLATTLVRDVMRRDVVVLDASLPIEAVVRTLGDRGRIALKTASACTRCRRRRRTAGRTHSRGRAHADGRSRLDRRPAPGEGPSGACASGGVPR